MAAADPVICNTSRFCTVSCIHVPALDTKFATDHQRMLRCLRDRQGARETDGAGVEEDTGRYSETSRGLSGEGRGERNAGCAARRPPSPPGRGPSWQKGPPSRCEQRGGTAAARVKGAVVRGS
ncbi:hypothetical protein GCM10017779_69400 [Streptomyces capillispiralis]|nr:hypothetical protein GCM10017779_69400 [Streptomyces capillispiralis]